MADGLRVETALLSGWAGRTIVDYAREKRVDLIVVGTHGRTGITHAILGSVAETVVRLAPCLVLTVPASPQAGPSRRADRGRGGLAAVPGRGATSDGFICEGCRTRMGAALEQRARRAARPGAAGMTGREEPSARRRNIRGTKEDTHESR
jgi:hypothetical protein